MIECVLYKVIMFPILYHEYDCNRVRHKTSMTMHSVVYRPGYHEAVRSPTLSYHSDHITVLCYQHVNP